MPVTKAKSRWTSGVLEFIDSSGNVIVSIDGPNRKLTIPSGSTLELASGATASLADEILAAADLALAEGSLLVGNAAGAAAALSAKTDGRILVGDGTTVASVAVSGDVTLAKTGAVTIGAAKVTNAMLASGAGVGALLTAGLGGSASYAKTADGVQAALVAADGAKDRAMLVVAIVDEAFADAGGNQPTFQVGETGTAAKFFNTAAFTGKAAGTVLSSAAINTSTKAVIVTAAKAVGAGTGGISVTALGIPTT